MSGAIDEQDDDEFYESIYGFPLTMNPHEFSPDYECCSPEEIARWTADCELYDSGSQIKNPREGSGWYFDESGKASFHLTTTAWGIGVTTFTNETIYPKFGDEMR